MNTIHIKSYIQKIVKKVCKMRGGACIYREIKTDI